MWRIGLGTGPSEGMSGDECFVEKGHVRWDFHQLHQWKKGKGSGNPRVEYYY